MRPGALAPALMVLGGGRLNVMRCGRLEICSGTKSTCCSRRLPFPAGVAAESASRVTPFRPAAAASSGALWGSNTKEMNFVRTAPPPAPERADTGSGLKLAELPGAEIGAKVTLGGDPALS